MPQGEEQPVGLSPAVLASAPRLPCHTSQEGAILSHSSGKKCTMVTTSKPLLALTAGDLMSRYVVRLPEGMPLQDAARLLLRNQIGGAPVVDALGKCVGALSAIDFLRLVAQPEIARHDGPALPLTCSFQVKSRSADGKELVLCALPPGVCPIQAKQHGPNEEELLVCGQPHCVLADWQVVQVESLPTDEVRKFMTPDPVTVRPTTGIRKLARMMIDAHIHRIIVVDEERRPIGVVSSTDLLAALAYSVGEA
jgi:CBS domain-containing protein